ncbi:MAG TPA: hypothetical protein VHT29_12525 [Solirubrobacteraceae bacterium]|nr:hypothetical protein [Solirubrobacteraceae bacterium]
MPVAHEPAHVGHSDCPLLDQEACRHAHPPREQILAEARVAELGIGALQRSRRARQGPCHLGEGELAAVVARDDHTRQQIQPVTCRGGVVAHTT